MKYAAIPLVLAALQVCAAENLIEIGGRQYWLNGINLPWIRWEDFDDPWGSNNYNHDDFEDAFQRYADHGINAVRVWVHCKGEGSPVLNADAEVTGPPDVFHDNFSDMMALASQYSVFVMPALFSFDILKDERVITKYPHNTASNFAVLVASEEKTQTYIDNFLVPLLERYDTCSALFCWEVCNEPEWMSENLGADQNDVIRFNAQIAAAIHEHGAKPVSTGAASLKWYGVQHDWWSDAALQEQYDDANACFDIVQVHYYDWMNPSGEDDWGFDPFMNSTAELGLDDRPVIIGETPGDGGAYRTATEMYETAYDLGYAGVFAWSDQAGDGIASFAEISEATDAFYSNHQDIVDGLETSTRRRPSAKHAPARGSADTEPAMYDLQGRRMRPTERPYSPGAIRAGRAPGTYIVRTKTIPYVTHVTR
ncbi:MAG: cellulase family glycosylhydrolase [Chitinivibrionales bacterium]|nr:cellulase family glycosylhydrolase [Chitinivibrionales bacterium]MBD3394863.1 cellulase family glycosylhydrolase [Chitinivibrionales bacterium]